MRLTNDKRRYGLIPVIVHWLAAGLILFQFLAGYAMVEAFYGAAATSATRQAAVGDFQIHKALGIVLLGIAAWRVVWRVLNPAPPIPPGGGRLVHLSSNAAHIGFYLLLLAIPASGWIYASLTGFPTPFFGLFNLPQIAWVSGGQPYLLGLALPFADNAAAKAFLRAAHLWLGYALLAMIALHALAAFLHHLLWRDTVLLRMLPVPDRWLRAREEGRPAPPPGGDKPGLANHQSLTGAV